MDHLRLLYKSNGAVLSPKNRKRKTANVIRATKRSELYSSTRNISLSPQPLDERKENFKPPTAVAPLKPEDAESARLDAPPAKISEKQSRQKAFIMRYMAWKAEKARQTQLKEQKIKRAPFVVPIGSSAAIESRSVAVKKSFAPLNHVFNPPANLEDLRVEITGENTMRCVNGDKEATFQFVATPKKKPIVHSKFGSVKLNGNLVPVSKPKPFVAKTPKTAQKPAATTIDSKAKFPLACTKKTAQTPAASTMDSKAKLPLVSTKKTPSTAPKEAPKTTGKQKVLPFSQSSQKSAVKRELKPSKTPNRPIIPVPLKSAAKPLEKPPNNMHLRSKMPPPSQQAPKPGRRVPTQTGSTTTKLKPSLPPLKRPTFKAPKKTNSSISNAVLTMKGNARSKVPSAPPALKLNGKSLLQSITETAKLADPIPETPTDLNTEDSYLNFVTSTKRKSSSSNSNAGLIFAELASTISPVDGCCPTEDKTKEKSDKKFDFIRYSVVQSEEEREAAKPEEPAAELCAEANVTPDKTPAPPTTYMSPYVSVSRGKVSTRIEREKRNSIYMAADSLAAATPEKTPAVRHTLATVRYYRKQLMDEIARLNDRCASWEQYKEANIQLVEDSGVDMINVTIGQTKLLTTKKLKQFGGLIDRCEDGVLGKSSIGDGEGAKPILPEDLEGFWSMVGLQIENVDKRFAELERWKTNNWTDPDEATAVKPINSLANAKRMKKRKPVSTAARPNGALQKMLRTAHAAYLNKKAVGGADEDVILTPSKSRQVLIMNRRSRSAAATVITVNTPRTNRKSSAFEVQPATDLNETPKLLPHINGFRRSMNLLRSTLMSEQERKSPVSPVRNAAMFRKSILKTPGSKSRPKSVIFNSPMLKFTIEDTVDDSTAAASSEEQLSSEEAQRTYKLRNRRIVLRDSAEFVIPK